VTPDQLSALHARAFPRDRHWSADEFRDLLASPGIFIETTQSGFALGRVVLDEAELIMIAVAPGAQRKGVGRGLLCRFEASAQAKGALVCHLEVAADNVSALSLYQATGYTQSGCRPGYYRRPNAAGVDAVMMFKNLT